MTEEEKRKYNRLKRPLIVSYQVFDNQDAGYDATQIKDISVGGMRFVTSQSYPSDTILSVELRIPFTEERLKLKASVIESKEVTANLIYDTRVRFLELGRDEQEFLSKIINLFLRKTI